MGDEWLGALAEELRRRGCGGGRVRAAVYRGGLRDLLAGALGWCGSIEVAGGSSPSRLLTVSFGPVSVLGYPLGGELASLLVALWDATRGGGLAAGLLRAAREAGGLCVGGGCARGVDLSALPGRVFLATTPHCAFCPHAFVALSSLAWLTGMRLTSYCISDDVEEGGFTGEDVAAAFAAATGVEPLNVPLVVADGRSVLGAPPDSAAALAFYLFKLGAVRGFGSAGEFVRALQDAGVL